MDSGANHRRHRHRLRRPGDGRRLRRARQRGLVHRHRRREDRAPAAAARSRSTSPGSRSCVARAPRAPALLDRRRATRSSTRGCCSSPSAPRRRTRATPTSSAVHAVVDAMPPSDRHALVMKSTVPVGTGGVDQARLPRAGKEGFRYVSCPEFLKEGSAIADFLQPDRVVIGDDGDWAGDAVAELYRPLLTRARRRRRGELVRTDIAQRGDGQARRQRVPGDEDLVHQRDRQRLRGDRRRRRSRSPAASGLDDRIGPKFLQAGHRLRRQLLPEGRQRAQAARGQLAATTSSCSTPSSRSTSCRSAASSASSQKHLGALVGQADRAARARLQAEHRRHARGVARSS